MAHTNSLRRELGFWTALTIGAGTMIGAGIFLLSGVAIQLTGPAAIISYVSAGIVCLVTAASAAELATGMPTSGGDYFFVSRSLGPSFGAISGIGIWLSLTFAIAFYLFGLGEYVHEFLNISPVWIAFAAGVLLTALNVIGAKESGGTQLVVVLTLLVILIVFVISAAFYIDPGNWNPFFPYGKSPILTTTALVFISFLGFVKIAAVSEEIKDPSRNLPRALIGSVTLVSFLYILIVLVLSGFFSGDEIAQTKTPLTLAAETMFGRAGGAVLIFAGLLATLSSANASIMAASRINLAMSRDGMIPNWLSEIHPERLTPYRAILLTGALSLIFLTIKNLETLAEIASVLQLYSYAALNIGCVILRVANPEWYRPTFRVPGTPVAQILAAAGCIGIILFSGLVAQAIIMALIAVSLIWYFAWGAKRVNIRFGMPQFRQHWSDSGWRVLFQSPTRYAPALVSEMAPTLRLIDSVEPRQVMVAIANPAHETDLLRLGRYLATGETQGGSVTGIHLVKVPLQTPLNVARGRFAQRPSIERSMAALAVPALASNPSPIDNPSMAEPPSALRPVEKTTFTAFTDVAHDVFGSLISESVERKADLLLMGWHVGFNVSYIYNSPVQRIMTTAPFDVAVLKNRGLEKIKRILVPWGGGPHAQLGLEFAARIRQAANSELHVLRVTQPQANVERERKALIPSVEKIVNGHDQVHYHVEPSDDFVSKMLVYLDSGEYDLVIIGASHEWRIRSFLFGSIPDLVADRAKCSVLMVRRHFLEH